MTKDQRKTVLEILDEEWLLLQHLDLKGKAPMIQYASAIWYLLEFLPSRDKFLGEDD